ncbi:branched-chain-amino-acid aminotransferase [bacterium BMS3Abin10]|nr:branched-chain-amino-acid aminotransferase [bacterium BMS3Abin10]GBE38787.1 branched-chain-amino-acid aminotransferase [bacterium BMS3Bbin08]HDH49969.1 branched-chain amino acid transaminase [Nitrospirota bacterium]HDK17101.1 branched-chain amino acid transaminase [Nitrospirota bacterium]
MIQESKKIWMDGRFVNWADANVHILTHTLHYGLGAFEGIRCYKTPKGSAIFRLKEHVGRLFNSCHILDIDPLHTPAEISRAIIESVKINRLKECYIRPIVYIGYGAMGIYPTDNPIRAAIAVWPWGAYLGEDGIKNGIKVKIASFTRHHVNVTMTKSKTCGDYVNSILAKREAVSSGYDEALLLDPHGYVSEGSGQNIFIVRNGILKTPSLTSILEGITRNSVIQMARNAKLKVREASITRDELYIADEAFFTGTAAEITPIKEVDGRTIGNGRPGPVTKKLQNLFFRLVKGNVKAYKSWLTYI